MLVLTSSKVSLISDEHIGQSFFALLKEKFKQLKQNVQPHFNIFGIFEGFFSLYSS